MAVIPTVRNEGSSQRWPKRFWFFNTMNSLFIQQQKYIEKEAVISHMVRLSPLALSMIGNFYQEFIRSQAPLRLLLPSSTGNQNRNVRSRSSSHSTISAAK